MTNYYKNLETISRHEDDALNSHLRRYDEHGENCGCNLCWDNKQEHCKLCDCELYDYEIGICETCLEGGKNEPR